MGCGYCVAGSSHGGGALQEYGQAGVRGQFLSHIEGAAGPGAKGLVGGRVTVPPPGGSDGPPRLSRDTARHLVIKAARPVIIARCGDPPREAAILLVVKDGAS
jgi:hypothetical protein